MFFYLKQLLKDVAKDSLKRTNDRVHTCENTFPDEYVENTVDLANTTEFLKDAVTFKSLLMRQMEDQRHRSMEEVESSIHVHQFDDLPLKSIDIWS